MKRVSDGEWSRCVRARSLADDAGPQRLGQRRLLSTSIGPV